MIGRVLLVTHRDIMPIPKTCTWACRLCRLQTDNDSQRKNRKRKKNLKKKTTKNKILSGETCQKVRHGPQTPTPY